MSLDLRNGADVVRALLGEPNPRISTERVLRWGNRGSKSFDIAKSAFFDHETNNGGGLLDLIVHEGAAHSRQEARRWLAQQGFTVWVPARKARVESPHRAEQSRQYAKRLYQTARPIAGTLGEAYLLSRAIDPSVLEGLRFRSGLKNVEVGRELPAIVARISSLHSPSDVRAVQRIWLDGNGQKAKVMTPRKTVASAPGCAVVLQRFGDTVLVGEGIETVASAAMALGVPGVATLGTANMVRLAIPAQVGHVVIAHDRDDSGAGLRAATALAQRLWAEGRKVYLAPPPGRFNDWNDAAQATSVGGGINV